jgi:hypothetical protein
MESRRGHYDFTRQRIQQEMDQRLDAKEDWLWCGNGRNSAYQGSGTCNFLSSQSRVLIPRVVRRSHRPIFRVPLRIHAFPNCPRNSRNSKLLLRQTVLSHLFIHPSSMVCYICRILEHPRTDLVCQMGHIRYHQSRTQAGSVETA